MKNNKPLELLIGGVYTTDLTEDLVRVVAFDDFQVFYDTWWEHCSDWGYKNSIKKKFYYSRTIINRFLKSASFINLEH